MKKLLLTFAIFSCCIYLNAQSADALIKTEKEFEKSCLKLGLRQGFLAFMDSMAIDFSEKGIVSAKKTWSAYPDFPGVFSWSPSFAEMSVSGDWGYTTGNYEHRPKTLSDTVSETGQYTTIWHKNLNGEWKYLIDLGNVHPAAPLAVQTREINIAKVSSDGMNNEKIILDPEKQFIQALEKNPGEAYKKYAGTEYILNRSGFQAITSTDSAVLLLNKMPGAIKYIPSGAEISNGKDMAAVYGIFVQGEKKGRYMRIWRFQKSGWKIALELITD